MSSKKNNKTDFQIPKSHPRYESLLLREKIVDGVKAGITAPEGLIAQGRGEAFDYLLGEETIPSAEKAINAAAAALLLAKNPVISVNGNVTALSAESVVELSKVIPAKIEVNIFHYSNVRFSKIIDTLKKFGGKDILGEDRDKLIPGLDHARAGCTNEGIYSADVVLVPLEDGDRALALTNMGKMVITVDLNPLSRTAKVSNITIVDNLIRAIPKLMNKVKEFKRYEKNELLKIRESHDNSKNLKEVLNHINQRLYILEF